MSENASLTEGIRPEALDERQIEDLIAEHLQQHLEILPEQDLANALHNFVDKVSLPAHGLPLLGTAVKGQGELGEVRSGVEVCTGKWEAWRL